MRELTRKPLSWFRRGSDIMQKQRSEAESRELGKSLRERQLSPVWAMSDGTLLIGYGRLEAATLEGLESLDVVITDEAVTEVDVLAIQFQENMLRQNLLDFEKVCIVERLRALCPKLMAQDLAERLRVDPSTITRLMSASKVVPAAREAFEAGAITLSHVYELSKLGSQQQHELLPVAVNGGNREAISTEERGRRNGNGPAIRLNRVKCPLSNATVVPSGDGDCLRCSKNEEGEASLPKSFAEEWIGGTLQTFILSEEEIAEVKARFRIELMRLLPGFFKSVTIAALLPVIQRRSLAFYLAKGIRSDAEDLAAKHVEKIWKQLFGGWPHGNPGSWVTTIRNSTLMDYFRAKKRERKHFTEWNDAALANVHDESFDETSFNEFVEEQQATSPELIAQHLRADAKWARTVASAQQKLVDAADDVMSMEVEGQSVPLRKKRRRRPE